MSMVWPKHRLYVSGLVAGVRELLSDEQHYVRVVLRCINGDRLTVLGEGLRGVAVVQADGARLLIESIEQTPRPTLELSVAAAVPKGDRADWLVEKLTELGVARLQWLTCERSVVVPKETGSKMQRWQRIAANAAKQSFRAYDMEIVAPKDLRELVLEPGVEGFVADLGGGSMRDAQPFSRALLVVGPEGGLTPKELLVLHEAGMASLSLGTTILRTETAAVVGASRLMLADL